MAHGDSSCSVDPSDAPDAGGWRDVVVPSCWTREGSWDSPHYTNVQMPFPGQPPEIPG